MTRSRIIRWFALWIFLSLPASGVFAETIELVTYYPSSATTGDLHVRSLTVGTAYESVTPTDGVALIYDKLGIGQGFSAASPPVGALHVVGFPGASDKALFMPGAGGSLNVGIGTAAPAATAILDITSTTQGFLPPRMTTAQRDLIPAPAAGLTIFNTTTGLPDFFNGVAWSSSGSSGSSGPVIHMATANGGSSETGSLSFVAAGTNGITITPRSTNSSLLVEVSFQVRMCGLTHAGRFQLREGGLIRATAKVINVACDISSLAPPSPSGIFSPTTTPWRPAPTGCFISPAVFPPQSTRSRSSTA